MASHARAKFKGFRPNPRAANEIRNLPSVQAYVRVKASELNSVARSILISRLKHTHPVTPPPAAASFKLRRIRKASHYAWQAYNDDPIFFMIEFGSYVDHPTHPMILRYRPYGLALDVLGAAH